MANSKLLDVHDRGEEDPLHEVLEEFKQTADDPLHRAFLTRALQALNELATHLSDDAIGDATSLSSDFEVLAAALSAAPDLEFDEIVSAELKAKLRGVEAKRKLLEADGGTASSSELGELLGLTRQAVDKRRRDNRLLAVQTGGRAYRYPVWQVDGGETLFGLEEVLEALADHDAWMTLQFFLRENPRLGDERPLDLLRTEDEGKFDEVLAAARTYGVQGAD